MARDRCSQIAFCVPSALSASFLAKYETKSFHFAPKFLIGVKRLKFRFD